MIKQGIETGDVSLIAQAYETLTGEKVVFKGGKTIVPLDTGSSGTSLANTPFRQPTKVRESNIRDEDFFMQITDPDRRRKRVNENGKEEIQTRSEPINLNKIKTVGNLFRDSEDIASDDKAFDKVVHVKAPVKRQRKNAVQTKLYKCEGGCGREELLLPIHAATGHWFCNECIKNKSKGR
jgi:hypothetical protein